MTKLGQKKYAVVFMNGLVTHCALFLDSQWLNYKLLRIDILVHPHSRFLRNYDIGVEQAPSCLRVLICDSCLFMVLINVVML